ncbi:MAG: ribbon-helix-helix protein, CopG family [Candidatus Dadabacteria bacterium]|nr:MAG: ribbon-helix-helix protein, CopG family [Candidatus Dadabacteria bacterium]
MSVALQIELPDDLAKAVEGLSKRLRRSQDAFVRQIIEQYIEAIEDAIDNEEADRILADPDAEWVPWEQIKAELGL